MLTVEEALLGQELGSPTWGLKEYERGRMMASSHWGVFSAGVLRIMRADHRILLGVYKVDLGSFKNDCLTSAFSL